MPATIAINTVVGSNESAVDLDGATSIVFSNPARIGATVDQWEFLEWPVGTLFNQTWLTGVGAGGHTVTILIPDIEGTWVVKYTDTNDGTTDTIICGIKNRRTSLRIPGAGETTESANTIFPSGGAITNHRGWALTRDLGLKYLDDLVTSGAVQIFYLEDGTIPAGGINAGTPLALVKGAPEVLFQGNALAPYNVPIRVPKVYVAQADLATSRNAYVGVLKAGRDLSTPLVSNTSYGYITTAVPSGTFVWVSTSGLIQGEAATGGAGNIATLDFTAGGWTVGDIVYLSDTTAGALVRDSDTFAAGSTASELMTPVGIVGDTTNAQGSMVVLPRQYGGNPVSSAKTEMFRGIGDYSSVRVGRTDDASVAGEQDGTIELCAIAGEAITAGDIVCISTNGGGVMQAFVADSSNDPAVANNKKYGIFGVAVQSAAITDLSHFTVFGEANATTTGAVTGGILYVGSSTGGIADDSGIATSLARLDDTESTVGTYLKYDAETIPLGVYDGNKLILGTTEDQGILNRVYGSDKFVDSGTKNINLENNTSQLALNKANVYRYAGQPSSTTWVDFPNTESDSVMMTTSIYEDTLKGSDLYDVDNQSIGGKVWTNPPVGQVDQDITAASLNNNVWVGVNGGGAEPSNTLYGTFVLEDDRYFDELVPIAFEVHGYTDSHTASADIDIELRARINYQGGTSLDLFKTSDRGVFTTESPADVNRAFTIEYFSVTSAGNVFYVPKYDATGSEFFSVDIILDRRDATDASVMIEKVVLQALYPNKNISLTQGYPPVVYENKIPAYTLIDSRINAFNIIDDGLAPIPANVNNPCVGISMTSVGGRTLSEPIGFVPYDSRIQDTTALTVSVLGKYMGNNPLGTSLDLEFIYEELFTNNNYDPDITVAGTVLTNSYTPAGSGAGDYELVKFVFSIPTPDILASGLRFRLRRTGTSPIVDGGAATVEISFQLSNIYFESDQVDSSGVIEDVYEESSPAASVVDIDDALSLGVDTHFGGFEFPGGVAPSAESLFIPAKFDKRYDYRQNIIIDVYGYVTTSSVTNVDLELAISNFHDHDALAPATGASYFTLQKDSVAIVAATDVYQTKHTFTLNAKDVWDLGVFGIVPEYNQFRNSGNAGLMLRLKRNDANGAGVPYTAMSVKVSTGSSKKTSTEAPYINVSENILDVSRKYLEVKSSYRADVVVNTTNGDISARNLLASAHRHYFQYAIDDQNILAAGTADVFPVGVGTALVGRVYGWIVPHNMAIVGIYGYGVDGASNLPTGVEIKLSLVDSAGASQDANDGVLHMPVETDSLASGWRWVGNPLNFNVPSGDKDLQDLPLIYLPHNYSSTGWDDAGPPPVPVPVAFAGDSWLLKCEVTNNSVGAIDLTANITVEAVLIPNYNVID